MYTTKGSSTAVSISTSQTFNRQLGIYGGQLYGCSNGGFEVFTVGTGTPTTVGQTMVHLPGLSHDGTYPPGPVNSFAFIFLDVSSSVTGVDTLYVADGTATAAAGGGVLKYCLASTGGSWLFMGNLFTTDNHNLHGVTGSVVGSNVVLYAVGTYTNADTSISNTLFQIVDNTG